MGCTGSRLRNPESVPARFRPILRRRIEEVQRRRRMGSTKDDSSKKELLLSNIDVDKRRPNIPNVTKEEENVVFESPRKAEEKEREMNRENENESKKEGDEGNRKSDSGATDLDGPADDASIFCPGSPSFRIYFVDNGEGSDDEDNHCLETVKEVVVEEKLHTNDLDPSPEKDFGSKPIMKKVRKKRSLKKVIPRGGQAAVKNLLNVKTCYLPTRHDRAHLLSEKPQT